MPHHQISRITAERDALRAELQRRDRENHRRAADLSTLVDLVRQLRRDAITVFDHATRLAHELDH